MNPIMATEYIVFISALVLLVSAYLSWKSTSGKSLKLRIITTTLRCCGIIVLTIIALNPGYWKKENMNTSRKWVLLLDRSSSMAVKDVDKRTARLKAAINIVQNIIKKYPEENINVYTFAKELDDVALDTKKLKSLKPDGSSTDIYKSCGQVIERFAGSMQKLSGIILLSDGKQIVTTDPEDFIMSARAENIAVHAFAYGEKVAYKDLSLKLPNKSFVAFAGQTINILTLVNNKGMGNVEINLQISNAAGKNIISKKVRIPNNSNKKINLKLAVKDIGFQEFNVKISSDFKERIKWNNSTRIGITVMKEKLNVLYLEGQPFWDSKFLSQILRKDKNINLTTIYRIASGRFFSVKSGSAETAINKKHLFPASAKELSKYNLIILGHGIKYFLTPEKINILHKYLAEYGGAVIFARGKPYTGQFPQLSNLEPVSWGKVMRGTFKWQPSAYGISTGFFGNMQFDKNSKIWRELPPLKKITTCKNVKNFAEVLLYANTRKNGKDYKIPVLISRKFGKGIVITANAEGMWQWGFFPQSKSIGKFYRRFWGQIIQQVIKYSEFLPGMDISLRFDKTVVMPDTPVMAMINTRDPKVKIKNIKLNLYSDGELSQSLTAVKNISENAGWNAFIVMNNPGVYELRMSCLYQNGKTTTLRSILYVKHPPGEEDDLSADPQRLKSLCLKTGGKLLNSEDDLKDIFAKQNISDNTNIQKSSWVSNWTSWLLLCLLLSFFATDYFLRRRNGLL
jgi:von Willebrand factor type A domain